MQYIAPTLQFTLAVVFFGEALSVRRLVAFVMVWLSIAFFLSSQAAAASNNHFLIRTKPEIAQVVRWGDGFSTKHIRDLMSTRCAVGHHGGRRSCERRWGQGTARRPTGKCRRIQLRYPNDPAKPRHQNPPPSPRSRSFAATRPRRGLRVWHGSGCPHHGSLFRREIRGAALDADPIDGARRIRGWRCGRQEFGWLTPGRRSSVLPSLLASRWHWMVPMRQYPPRSVALGVLPRPEPFARCLFGPPQAFRPVLVPLTQANVFQDHHGIRTLPRVGSTPSRGRSRRSKKSSRPSESHWASWLTRLASIVGRGILKNLAGADPEQGRASGW